MSGRPDRLTWLGHATAVIDLDGVRLVTDPAVTIRMGHLRRRAPAVRAPEGADAVLISHLHLDHLHGPSLRRVGAPIAVVPRGGGRHLRRSGADVREVAEGDEVAVGAVRVRAVHAEHDGRRWPGRPATPALGYVVRGPAPSTSPATPTRTRAWRPSLPRRSTSRWCRSGAGAPGWARATSTRARRPRRGAAAAARAVPIHWGTYATAWARRRPAAVAREPAEEFARHAAAVAPEVEVVLLRPGEATPLDG